MGELDKEARRLSWLLAIGERMDEGRIFSIRGSDAEYLAGYVGSEGWRVVGPTLDWEFICYPPEP